MSKDDNLVVSKDYEYIHFAHAERKPKTEVWWCTNRTNGARLGIVKWHGQWRQYCYFAEGDTLYSKGCLDDISDFLSIVNKAHKE